MDITTTAAQEIPNWRLIFCTLSGVEGVSRVREDIVGRWSDSPYLLLQRSKPGALIEEFVNCSSIEQILDFTSTFGPLDSVNHYHNVVRRPARHFVPGQTKGTIGIAFEEPISNYASARPILKEFRLNIEKWKENQEIIKRNWKQSAKQNVKKLESNRSKGEDQELTSELSATSGRLVEGLAVIEGEEILRVSDKMLFRTANLDRLLKFDLWSAYKRVRLCDKPDCGNLRYFIADHLSQRYCSKVCSDWAQKEHRKKWWLKHGKEMRHRQKELGREES